MIQKIKNTFQSVLSFFRFRKDPGVIFALTIIRDTWENNTALTKDYSKEFIERQAAKMAQSCINILSSTNPLMQNRERLCESVLECTKYQVLVIDAPPSPDPTNLRGHFGISGELKARLLDIVKTNEELKNALHVLPPNFTYDDVFSYVVLRYRLTWAYTHIYQALRGHFSDINQENDWFKGFYASMCAWHEHNYRKELGLQDTLSIDGRNGDLVALSYSTYLNAVMSGAQYPDLEWEKGALKDIENPKSVEYT